MISAITTVLRAEPHRLIVSPVHSSRKLLCLSRPGALTAFVLPQTEQRRLQVEHLLGDRRPQFLPRVLEDGRIGRRDLAEQGERVRDVRIG
jgi:hypothetical protein